jgi:hypothetical protein
MLLHRCAPPIFVINSSTTVVICIMYICVYVNVLYSSPNIIWVIKSRRMRRAGHVACMGERSGAYRILVGRPEGRRPLGRPRRRCDNIKMALQEMGFGHGLD